MNLPSILGFHILLIVGTLRVPFLLIVACTLREPFLNSSRDSPCAVSSEKDFGTLLV